MSCSSHEGNEDILLFLFSISLPPNSKTEIKISTYYSARLSTLKGVIVVIASVSSATQNRNGFLILDAQKIQADVAWADLLLLPVGLESRKNDAVMLGQGPSM